MQREAGFYWVRVAKRVLWHAAEAMPEPTWSEPTIGQWLPEQDSWLIVGYEELHWDETNARAISGPLTPPA